jgi:hypothetical protein
MEDHGGRLVLDDRAPGPGAVATLVIPWPAAAAEPERASMSAKVSHGA